MYIASGYGLFARALAILVAGIIAIKVIADSFAYGDIAWLVLSIGLLILVVLAARRWVRHLTVYRREMTAADVRWMLDKTLRSLPYNENNLYVCRIGRCDIVVHRLDASSLTSYDVFIYEFSDDGAPSPDLVYLKTTHYRVRLFSVSVEMRIDADYVHGDWYRDGSYMFAPESSSGRVALDHHIAIRLSRTASILYAAPAQLMELRRSLIASSP